ncbi:MAG: hypothetical protein PHF63_06810 [Herbinix sp.]|nr:hypothetical protein [Herbinix sp.]
MELFRLFGTVLIEDQEAINTLKNVDNQGKKTKTSLQDIADKGAKIGAAVVAGTGIAVTGLMALANGTAENADKWDKLSLRTGIAVENLQRWGYAAEQSGADISVLETGMKKLSKSVVDAQNGSKDAQKAYEELGISMSELSNMSPEQTFDAVMKKLADMPDSAEKNVLGNQLLGKSYTELKPLLAAGSEGMQALKDRADELGIVMSGESVTAGVAFGDTLADVKSNFDGVKNKIVADLLPQLTNMLNWFIEKSPQIQSVAGATLGFVSDIIGFIADHSNILIPILGGLLGAIMALQAISVVNGLMTAWKASTISTTLAQGGLNAVLMANPIALVIAAIAALIAIGIALYMNWDKIKEKAGSVFEKLKDIVGGGIDKIKGFFEKIINFVKDNWQGLLLLIVNPFAGAFKLAYDNCEGFRNKVNSIFEKIKTTISDKVDAIKTGISTVFGTIKDIMANPFEAAKDIISGVIDKIKGFLNFNWEFPKLKMPHFSVTGSMNPLDWVDGGLPKLSVDWYAKGGIFDKPTIFNTPYGLKGVGDAKSPEVVAPLDNLKSMLGLDKQNKESKVEVNVNIENFNNNSDSDIEELADELAFQTKRKLEGSGVFA